MKALCHFFVLAYLAVLVTFSESSDISDSDSEISFGESSKVSDVGLTDSIGL